MKRGEIEESENVPYYESTTSTVFYSHMFFGESRLTCASDSII